MRKFIEEYFKSITFLFSAIRITNREGDSIKFCEGMENVFKLIKSETGQKKKIIFIGNGASAAISSHMSADFWKNGGVRAVAFNDSSLLTCVGNDYGYEHVFEKPIEMFADKSDILVAISSSGKSENILNGVRAARAKECHVITLSGFDENNPLSIIGDLNFYVPAHAYGFVEVIHHSICHCILDTIISQKKILQNV